MTYEYRQAARILLYQGPHLLVLRANGESFTHLVGGGVESGETPLQAVLRECIEELGYGVGYVTFVTILHHTWETAPVHETMYLYRGVLEQSAGFALPRARESWLTSLCIPWQNAEAVGLQPKAVYPWLGVF